MSSLSQATEKLDIRSCAINPNCWYVVARSTEVKSQPVGVVLWHQPIVLYRDSCGIIHALEDRCPHRRVELDTLSVTTLQFSGLCAPDACIPSEVSTTNS